MSFEDVDSDVENNRDLPALILGFKESANLRLEIRSGLPPAGTGSDDGLLERLPDFRLAVDLAKKSRALHASFMRLGPSLPLKIFGSLSNIIRLDVGHNEIEVLPIQLGSLSKLEQLWVNGNCRLSQLPRELANCSRLKLIDARATGLVKLPAEIGTLENIQCIDLTGVETLKPKVYSAYYGSVEDISNTDRLDKNDLDNEVEETKGVQLDCTSKEELEQQDSTPEIDSGEDSNNSVERTSHPTSDEVIVSTRRLKSYLKRRFDTKQLKVKLEERLRENVYREVCEVPTGLATVRMLIKAIFKEFDELDDVKDVIRNCERLFAPRVEQNDVSKIRKKFLNLRRQNEKKKLSANLELKLRAFYYDRIDPAAVEGVVNGIYAHVRTLEDVHFLIKHASTIFPDRSEDIDPVQVSKALQDLKQLLAEQRAAAVASVAAALRLLYPHVEPVQVGGLADAVCKYFSKIDDLKKLAADASQYFPAEYEAAITDPKLLRGAFLQAERDQLDP